MVCVEKRYAIALVEEASKNKCLEKVYKDFDTFVNTFNANESLYTFLSDNNVPFAAKYSFIDSLLLGCNIEFINFIKILLDNSRIKYLSKIHKYFIDEYYIKKEILIINITSANKVDKGIQKKIEETYIKKYNAKRASTNIIIDPSLIGGLIIQIGDTYINSSIKEYLHVIKNTVTKEV